MYQVVEKEAFAVKPSFASNLNNKDIAEKSTDAVKNGKDVASNGWKTVDDGFSGSTGKFVHFQANGDSNGDFKTTVKRPNYV